MKESAQRLEANFKATKLLLHKALLLQEPRYFPAIEKLSSEQTKNLQHMELLLKDAPKAQKAMKRLSSSLNDYWLRIEDIKNKSNIMVPQLIEGVIDKEMSDLHANIEELAIERSKSMVETTSHVTNILLFLVIGTAFFGSLISLLYAAMATHPIRTIRHALTRIGNGQLAQNLELGGLEELRELSHTINTMQAKLRKHEQAKNDALSLISHELKTPLAAFQSGIELLRSGNVGTPSDKQAKVIEIMGIQAIRLNTSIQEMLDMQSIQAQRLVLDIRPHALTEIIKDAIECVLPLTMQKNQHIHWDSPTDNYEVLVDPERTKQVLINLLSNANKYSPRDTNIVLTIKCHDKTAELIVEDEGPGIPEHYLNCACDRFFQVPIDGAHLHGTGLGLAIVKEIAVAQKGRIELANRTPHGLRVLVTFPLCNDTQ